MATAPASVARADDRLSRQGSCCQTADLKQLGQTAAVLGGGVLALYGLRKRSLTGLGLALLGGGLAYRSATGRPELSSVLAALPGRTFRAEAAVAVSRSPEELYRFFRDLQNWPRFMRQLESVRTAEANRFHAVIRGPGDIRIERAGEIIEDRPGELIRWRTVPGSTVPIEGSIRFTRLPADRGTAVKAALRYELPAGSVAALLLRLLGASPAWQLRENIRRFKRLMETGEIPTTRGQPSGRGRDVWEQTQSMVLGDWFARGLGWFSIGLGLAELATPAAVARLAGVRDHRGLLRLLGARELASGVGILSNRPRPVGWLWGRVAGDAVDIGLLGTAMQSDATKHGRASLAAAALIGVTLLDVLAASRQTLANEP